MPWVVGVTFKPVTKIYYFDPDGLQDLQVDERVAPVGSPDRNLTHLQKSLLEHVPLRSEQIHAMPVDLPDLEAAAAQYGGTLSEIAGSPPVLDLIQLGLGADGERHALPPLRRHRVRTDAV